MHQNFKCSDEEANEVICSLNKKIDALEQNDFEELTLPQNVTLRNLALGRYLNL